MVLVVLAAPALLILRARPALLAGALLVVFLAQTLAARLGGDEHVARERTFFGVYRIVEADGLRSFYHGTTLHGAERRRADGTVDSRITYYGPGTPYAELLASLARRPDPLVLGIAGLGTGSLACFVRPGDEVRIYEIDPAVVRLAREHFAALHTCAPDADIAVGDARLLLEREATALDFLALDAFTSDAIPVHLLTEEAFRSYLRVLAPEGVLAVHVSNRHLDLEPVVAALAERTGLRGRIKRYAAPEALMESRESTSSHLVALARDQETLRALDLDEGWVALGDPGRVRVWTGRLHQHRPDPSLVVGEKTVARAVGTGANPGMPVEMPGGGGLAKALHPGEQLLPALALDEPLADLDRPLRVGKLRQPPGQALGRLRPELPRRHTAHHRDLPFGLAFRSTLHPAPLQLRGELLVCPSSDLFAHDFVRHDLSFVQVVENRQVHLWQLVSLARLCVPHEEGAQQPRLRGLQLLDQRPQHRCHRLTADALIRKTRRPAPARVPVHAS